MMKKIFILILFALITVSCQGPVGPQGPPGPSGPPGPIGQAFDVIANFTPSNNFSQIFVFPEDVTVFKSDIVLVYLRWKVNKQTGYKVWQPLPLSVFFTDGELQYAFDYTVADVRLFLTGNINLNTLGPKWTDHQIFRVVIMPAAMANEVNLKDMDALMNHVRENNIQRYNIREL